MNSSAPKDHPKLHIYHLVALSLSLIGVVVFLASNHVSAHGSMGDAILFLLILIILGIFLCHSFFVSLAYAIKIKPNGYWGLMVNLVLIMILFSPAIFDFFKGVKQNFDFERSYYNQLFEACGHKNSNHVLSMINTMPAEEITHRTDHIDRCIDNAIRNHRIDLLNLFEANNITVVQENNLDGWRSFIVQVSSTQNVTPQDYNLLVWFIERGKKFNYRLSENIKFLEGYNICYTNLESPVAQQFTDLLIAMGGDINADTEYSSPVVWYCSRFNRLDQLKFLISRGANVHLDGGTSYHSAIGEAIDNYNPEIVNFLIQAGAKPRHNEWQDELELACSGLSDAENKLASQSVVTALKNAGFRFEKNSPYYLKPDRNAENPHYNTPEALQCLKAFE